MSLEDLLTEFDTVRVGPIIHARVTTLVRSALRKRDPRVYADGAHAAEDALDDVVHNFFEFLLGHGDKSQLKYAVDNSSSIDHFDALLTRQLKMFLARTRRRSVVDNLLDRSFKISDGHSKLSTDGRSIWCGEVLEQTLSEQQLRKSASLGLEAVPRIYTNPDERNPKIYTDDDLAVLLVVVLEDLGQPVTRRELHEILEFLLTPWLATVLGLEEDLQPKSLDLLPVEKTVVENQALAIVRTMTSRQVTIFRYKVSELSDTELARALGVSRPTAAKEKEELLAHLRVQLDELDERVATAVLGRIVPLTAGGSHG